MIRKTYLSIILILVAVLYYLFFLDGYFQIRQLFSSLIYKQDQVVLIEPEMESYKKKPEYPGGIEIPNSDSLIYERLRDSSKKVSINQVKLLPDPEKPIESALKNIKKPFSDNIEIESIKPGDKIDFSRIDDDPRFVGSIDDILENIGYYEESFMAQELEGSKPDLELDKELETKADGLEQEQSYGGIKIIKSYSSIHHTDTQSSEYRPGQGYLIQLAIARSSAQASKVWAGIKSKNNKILAKNNLILKKFSSKDERIFYLVLTGPYPSEYKAKLVCSYLKKNQQNCIITK